VRGASGYRDAVAAASYSHCKHSLSDSLRMHQHKGREEERMEGWKDKQAAASLGNS